VSHRLHARGRRCIAPGIMLACMLFVCRPVFALDPALDISQYAHTAWKIGGTGFARGPINAMAQTPDGYILLGTDFGLLRFDGVRTVPWQPPPDQQLPSNYVSGLLVGRDGTLWIGTLKGLVSWKQGKLTPYPEFAGDAISQILEDREGSIWIGGFGVRKLCAIRKGHVQCFGQDTIQNVSALYEDSKGNLWVGTEEGIWQWQPGPPKFYPLPRQTNFIRGLAEDDNGALLIGIRNGLQRLVDGKIESAYPFPGSAKDAEVSRLRRDRDGAVWIATSRGLVHVHQRQIDVFAQSDGLSSEKVQNLFEDREGNIWVVTPTGLDSFREFAIVTSFVDQGLLSNSVLSVLGAKDGTVWIGTGRGLNRWIDGHVTSPSTGTGGRGSLTGRTVDSLFEDDRGRIWISAADETGYLENDQFISIASVPGSVSSIAQDVQGNIWMVHQQQGLLRLSRDDTVQKFSWAMLGRRDSARIVLADHKQAGLWLGFVQSGTAYFADGQIRASYTTSDGLADGAVSEFGLEPDGTLWVATDGGLSRLKNGHFATLTSKNGLPCDGVHWIIEDDAHSTWLHMPCGLVRIPGSELDAWTAAADRGNDAQHTIHGTVFDSGDGVKSWAASGGIRPQVAKSSDGKLWFRNQEGVGVVDPRHLAFNNVPPPVHVEQVIADHKDYDVNAPLRLPPRMRDLQIDYTALSFVAPEKVRFKYKLEGMDDNWQDAGNRRQAFYTNLAPRNYRFRVIASNNSGVWNETGASFDFSVDPAYYQTTWFRLSVVAGFLVLIAAVYQLRMRQVAQRFDLRMQERMRVAQDLHDTLLQGCLSAAMRLHLAVDNLPDDAPLKEPLTQIQQLMTRVLDEGRVALRGLRFADSDKHDLEQAFLRTPDETAPGNEVAFRVAVEGRRRPLHPLIRDEVYRIGREAILNAFRHAHAQNIEVEIDFMPKQLRVLVRDDGSGIDPALASSGREGHFGLSGMRERADRIGGRLTVSSRSTVGTEIDLTVPGKIAFQVKPSRIRLWLAKAMRKRL
jgi:signal transduction histidine kinase/ligand-binding sensor domain-containing protein